MALLTNVGQEDYKVQRGERIAQLTVEVRSTVGAIAVLKNGMVRTDTVSPETRLGGFGSTGP